MSEAVTIKYEIEVLWPSPGEEADKAYVGIFGVIDLFAKADLSREESKRVIRTLGVYLEVNK